MSLLVPSPVGAASATQPGAATQSYDAGSSVLAGMIVELSTDNTSSVKPLSQQDIHDMLGVVVPANAAPLTLTPQTVSAQQVLVATSGRYDVLVTNQNGPVRKGDYITVSAVAGIGMKADSSQSEIIGQAATGFNGTNAIGTVSLHDGSGHGTVAVGSIPVDLRLQANPLFENASDLPGFLSRAATSIANKQVSPVRVYLSGFILLATLAIAGSMFYSSVRNGIIATGRNPLAKQAIGRSLVKTIVAGLVIFVAGMLAAYLILL